MGLRRNRRSIELGQTVANSASPEVPTAKELSGPVGERIKQQRERELGANLWSLPVHVVDFFAYENPSGSTEEEEGYIFDIPLRPVSHNGLVLPAILQVGREYGREDRLFYHIGETMSQLGTLAYVGSIPRKKMEEVAPFWQPTLQDTPVQMPEDERAFLVGLSIEAVNVNSELLAVNGIRNVEDMYHWKERAGVDPELFRPYDYSN